MINRNDYLDLRSSAAATFELSARLPDQVFKGAAQESLFCEFDAILTPDFWPALSAMAKWHGDERVDLLVLEPGCDEFYLPELGSYPAISLPVQAGADDYWAAIGFESDGNALASITISANVVAFTGPSGKWGCWGERDPEIAVFRGFPDATRRNDWCTQFGPFLDVAGALESYLPLTFAGWTVPGEYAAALSANYGLLDGQRR